ncbi:MAG: DUF2868 domain-containing protein [Gammaproteobacteria bacterium]|nr:DUF2868 domain-containing protein [Gammaproteobacteria bacterium]
MRQRALQTVLLVHAIEQTDAVGDALSLEDRAQASRQAADGRALPAAASGEGEISGDSQRFLVRRADALLARLRVRSPGVDRVLAAAAGPTGFDGAILLLGFVLGVAIAFADGGGRIDIFAYPLIGLVLWNLVIYIVLIVRAFQSPRASRLTRRAGGPAAMDGRWHGPAAMVIRDGFFRRWLISLYANRVRTRIDALITHSIGFNAPLAPGLRRFAADWWEVGRPLFRDRARRLLHLSAILAALGLIAGYDLRGGWILRQTAGWGTTLFGPASAHTALVTLYGAGSAVSHVPIPSAHDIQALAWTSPTGGGGPAGQWLHLIAWTALLYIVLPRLIAIIATTLSLWRHSVTLRTPPSFPGYLAAVLRPLSSPAPETPPARSSG